MATSGDGSLAMFKHRIGRKSNDLVGRPTSSDDEPQSSNGSRNSGGSASSDMVTMGPRVRDATTETDRPRKGSERLSNRVFPSRNPFKGMFGADGKFGDIFFRTNPGHITPPINHRSSTERSQLWSRPAIFQPTAGLALPERQSQPNTICEICELFELQTASYTFTLKRLANPGFDLNKWQRNQLITTARQAEIAAW